MTYAGVAFMAAATLIYEIALTRLFSVAYGYHFAFLAMSLGLLGFGASGTLLALRGRWLQRDPHSLLFPLAYGAALAFVGGYLLANRIPFDPYRVAWEPVQLVLLGAYLICFTAPFLFAGLVQGLPLTAWPQRAGRLYAAILAGSGVGAACALGILSLISAEGALAFSAVPAGGAAVVFAVGRGHLGVVRSFASAALIAVTASAAISQPGWLAVNLSAYKPLPQLLSHPEAHLITQRSDALSRIDVIGGSAIHSAPGLSLQYQGPIPQQTAVVLDGEIVSPVTSRVGLTPAFFDALPAALPYRLRPGGKVLVVEPQGGFELLAAVENNSGSVVAVESNRLLADVMRSTLALRGGDIYLDPRVRLVVGNPRSYLAGDPQKFDVVSLGISENRRTVTAGAFSLSENYRLTSEAFQSYLAHLQPGGILAVHRWLQLPPTEELRAAGLLVDALRKAGESPYDNLIAIRSFSTMLILAKNEPFRPQEISAAKAFVSERGFDLVHYPGIRAAEANRSNVLRNDRYFDSFRRLLNHGEDFFEQYRYDVAPVSDGRPFFFHFFKWEQTPEVLALLGKTWQPFGGSGYLIVLALLVVVVFISAALVVPGGLAIRKRRRNKSAVDSGGLLPMAYFAALGFGFLVVEVALVGRLIMLLDHPAQAFTIVLFGLLLSSGIGSAASHRVPWRLALGALAGTIVVYAIFLPDAISALLPHPPAVRIAATLLGLVPLGVLMGIPFPRGLAWVADRYPDWLPLAWGVNGVTSVTGAILAAMSALAWGFSTVLLFGALAYLLALFLLVFGRSGPPDLSEPAAT